MTWIYKLHANRRFLPYEFRIPTMFIIEIRTTFSSTNWYFKSFNKFYIVIYWVLKSAQIASYLFVAGIFPIRNRRLHGICGNTENPRIYTENVEKKVPKTPITGYGGYFGQSNHFFDCIISENLFLILSSYILLHVFCFITRRYSVTSNEVQ